VRCFVLKYIFLSWNLLSWYIHVWLVSGQRERVHTNVATTDALSGYTPQVRTQNAEMYWFWLLYTQVQRESRWASTPYDVSGVSSLGGKAVRHTSSWHCIMIFAMAGTLRWWGTHMDQPMAYFWVQALAVSS
jgi:hypothetical protein